MIPSKKLYSAFKVWATDFLLTNTLIQKSLQYLEIKFQQFLNRNTFSEFLALDETLSIDHIEPDVCTYISETNSIDTMVHF